jgi:hypothetical protein
MPKLPVHVQTHKEMFDQNQRIGAMHQKTADAHNRLSRLNDSTCQSVQQSSRGVDAAPRQQQL